MILVDLCQVNYQILLIICLKLIIQIAKHVWEEKMSNQNVSLLELKMIDYIISAKNVKEDVVSQNID